MELLRLSSDALPQAQRVEICCEIFGRKILKTEIEPTPGAPFVVDLTLVSLPGLAMGLGAIPPMRNKLTPSLIDNDDLVLCILAVGTGTAWQHGREAFLGDGQAVLTNNGEPAGFDVHSPTQVINLRFPRRDLAWRLAAPEAQALRPLSRDNQALRLLISYVGLVSGNLESFSPDLRRGLVDHIQDLAALALGANRDAAEIARGRGAKIARLRAIKADVVANLASDVVSTETLAARHRLSPRYIRGLFQSEGASLTDFVLNQRLAQAHRRLSAPGADYPGAVSAIAFETGFGDLSYFNRCFRRRYGATPSDIRAAAVRA
ncbi:AraC family transcriptional regulator [Methylocapsa sp. S129]|uniref:helix-turn-helix transcriptional regulator n=1 Tax=Methylocapsa sp. S129 TaxID=1641869 RepID=UPI001575A808|nr:AraC family transcriptional regulator [Methylocapsa sp. S129]